MSSCTCGGLNANCYKCGGWGYIGSDIGTRRGNLNESIHIKERSRKRVSSNGESVLEAKDNNNNPTKTSFKPPVLPASYFSLVKKKKSGQFSVCTTLPWSIIKCVRCGFKGTVVEVRKHVKTAHPPGKKRKKNKKGNRK